MTKHENIHSHARRRTFLKITDLMAAWAGKASHEDLVYYQNWRRALARPTKVMVDSLGAVIDGSPRWPWQPVQFWIGTHCGARLGEQFALRDIDVDLRRRTLLLRNSVRWPGPGRGVTFALAPIRTKTWREVPYTGSLHVPLLELCRASLGLPADAPEADVVAAQARKYADKFEKLDKVTLEKGCRPIEHDEGLLFVDPGTGLPPTREQHGDAWRSQRELSMWSNSIPWLQARHYTVTFWRATIVDPESRRSVEAATIARWLGYGVATLRADYDRPGDDEAARARRFLDGV